MHFVAQFVLRLASVVNLGKCHRLKPKPEASQKIFNYGLEDLYMQLFNSLSHNVGGVTDEMTIVLVFYTIMLNKQTKIHLSLRLCRP